MSRYMRSSQHGAAKPKEAMPPVWRGIGCLLLLIVPVLAWILADASVEWAIGGPWPLPYQLLGYPRMPAVLWGIPGLAPVLYFMEQRPHFYMSLLTTALYIVAFSALLSVAYAVIYRFVGPPRHGPYDVEKPDIRVGRYKR